MIKKGNDLRIGFHSIESIINHNPHKIKKIFLPSNRDDLRLNELISLIDKNDLKYEFSSKVKQEPEAIIANDPELNFKDFKDYLNSNLVNQPLILILDNVIDPRNLGACIRCAAVAGVDAMIINKHQCAPINAIAHKVSAGGVEVIKLFHVTNLVNCLKFLSEKNVNIYIYNFYFFPKITTKSASTYKAQTRQQTSREEAICSMNISIPRRVI